jgi:hypothetical protein
MKRMQHVGWIKGPMVSVAYCMLCPKNKQPFLVSVTKQKRVAAGSALAAAAKAKGHVIDHIKATHEKAG